MDASTSPRRRKQLVFLSVAMNLGLLCYFKYANYFLASLQQALELVHATASFPVLSVILPVGISFYTFEAISYTVDVYRGRIRAERNLAHFMLFILFFPHLIAGPIVRAANFLPQICRRKRWQWSRLNLGLQFFLLGLVKKLVIADRLARVVDPVFGNANAYGTTTLWLGALAWALQCYCDFSGYSDMAIGCAHLLGYRLCRNFDMPFAAPNISELWRRWHISLGSWLRDYVYIPMGGNRGTLWRTVGNLLITMTLCGLWHGAGWPFLIWGFLQGVMLGAHTVFRRFCECRPSLSALLESPGGTALRVAVTFTSFVLTFVIFRSPTLTAGLDMVRAMVFPRTGQVQLLMTSVLWCAALVALGHALAYRDLWKRLVARLPAAYVGMAFSFFCLLALLLATGAGRTFVYFQF
jgi:alginate O-acetyltransferase complex protein AlgI